MSLSEHCDPVTALLGDGPSGLIDDEAYFLTIGA
jgi:hypothetical protein